MARHEDDDLLDALGLTSEPVKTRSHTPQEERIIAGFEDILRFQQKHGRAPQQGAERDIFERLYALRLDQLRKLPEARLLLAALDGPGLLAGESRAVNPEELDDDALLAELGEGLGGADPQASDITTLRHVRSSAEKKAAEEIAERTPCEDFVQFAPLFEQVEQDIAGGRRLVRPFRGEASIEVGNLFIVGGLYAYVAEKGEEFATSSGQPDARLRVIYGNGTESNLLLRSLQKALSSDQDGRRIIDTEADAGPLFERSVEPDDIETGTLYVLRSHSTEPFVRENRDLIHKIGITGGKVEARISGAEHDATYLLAGVEVMAQYKLHNIRRSKLESLFHRLFAEAQLDLTLHDRFGHPVKPREWFLVPLSVIDEAVERLIDGTITEYRYDRGQARLVK